MIELRPYQEKMVSEIRQALTRNQSVLGVAPCGAGKTVMFSYIASRARERGARVGVYVHRQELCAQVSKTLKAFRVPHGIISAGQPVDLRHNVHVISAQTYARRIDNMPKVSIGIVDEAHHATSGSTWGKCMEHSPDAKWIGMSASPERLDGRGLGETFSEMIIGPSVRELIDIGALCDYRLFAPSTIDTSNFHMLGGDFNRGEANAAVDKPAITGNATEHYRKYLNGAPTIVFCASIAHAEHVAETFAAEGFSATSVDGKMHKDKRRGIIRDFSDGKLNILTSCDLVNEGLDIGGIHGCILLRPTTSLAVYIQQVGRAMRTAPGKQQATILDHVGNSARLGLPCLDREWSLDARKKAKAAPEVSSYRECGVCYQRSPISRTSCPGCNTPFAVVHRTIEQVAGELEEVNVAEIRKEVSPERKMQGQARSLLELEELAERLGRKKGWAKHVWEARMKKNGTRLSSNG